MNNLVKHDPEEFTMDELQQALLVLMETGDFIACVLHGVIFWKHIHFATDEDFANALTRDELIHLWTSGEAD